MVSALIALAVIFAVVVLGSGPLTDRIEHRQAWRQMRRCHCQPCERRWAQMKHEAWPW